jgi:hypothetical protein
MPKSICYDCTNRTSTCHAHCKYYAAEVQARDYDNRQRLLTYLGEYDNGLARPALRRGQFDRTGGR